MAAWDIGRIIGLTQHEVGVLRYKLKLPPRLVLGRWIPSLAKQRHERSLADRVDLRKQAAITKAIAYRAEHEARSAKRAAAAAAKALSRNKQAKAREYESDMIVALHREGTDLETIAAYLQIPVSRVVRIYEASKHL